MSKELGYKYVDLNKILNTKVDKNNKIVASKSLSNDIDDLLTTLDNCVIDCEYLILPEHYILYDNREKNEIIYLGFNNVNIEVLFEKFTHDYKSKNVEYDEEDLLNTLKYFKDISKKVCDDCNRYNFKFFDVCKDKNLVLQEVYEYILQSITKNH